MMMLALSLALSAALAADSKTTPPTPAVTTLTNRIPVYFEPNRGQFDPTVRFRSRGANYAAWITDTELILHAKSQTRNEEDITRIRFGKQKPANAAGLDPFPGRSNYFLGPDPKKWVTDVPNYAKAKLEEVYPGIDIVFYADGRKIEYDFIVKPGADASQIRVEFLGKDAIEMAPSGLISLSKPGGRLLKQLPPKVYQGQTEVAANPRLDGRIMRFHVGSYDTSRELTIDPTLVYATYVGGNLEDGLWDGDAHLIGSKPRVDTSGNLYFCGFSYGGTTFPFPSTPGAYTTAKVGGTSDAVVVKLAPTGSSLVYSTYLGGTGLDEGRAIAIDSSNNVYAIGVTNSTSTGGFPTTVGALKTSHIPANQRAGFVTKLNANGNALIYSTYVGVNSQATDLRAVEVDASGQVIVAGGATQFPVTAGAAQTTFGGNFFDAILFKLNAGGTAFVYSTYHGSGASDQAMAMTTDVDGDVYMTGYGPGAPTTSGAFQSNAGIVTNVWVTKYNGTTGARLWATSIGRIGNDTAYGIAVDSLKQPIITGRSGYSTAGPSFNWPLTAGTISTVGTSPCANAFVTKFNASGTALVWSTYLNNAPTWCNTGMGLAVDSSDNVWYLGVVGGAGTGTPFPVTADALQSTKDAGNSMTIAKINPTGTALLYSTFYGGPGADNPFGIALSPDQSRVYVSGQSNAAGFPTTSGAFSGTHRGDDDLTFLALDIAAPSLRVNSTPSGRIFSVTGAGCSPGTNYTTPLTLAVTPSSSCTVTFGTPQSGTTGTQYVFNQWDNSSTNPARTVFTTGGLSNISATFDTQYLLTSSAGTGGSVSPSGTNYYNAGTTVNLTATASSGYTFSSWTGSVASASSASTSIVMNAPQTVSASFVVSQVTLTTAASPLAGGTVSPATGPQTLGSVVNVTATANPGYRFTGFTGACTGNGPCSVTMNSAQSVTANFVQTFQLTTAATPVAGGTVTPASGTYDSGSVVNVTATANPGYRFTGFTGACTGNGPCSVTMNSAQSVTANFVQTFQLSTAASPVAGGTVTPASGTYDSGAVVSVTATANAGYRFTGFTGACTGTGPCSVTMNSAQSVTANFVQTFDLTTVASPLAGGMVTPATGTYDSGSVVNVSATANPGYR